MDVNLILFKKDGSQKFFELPSSTTVMGRRNDCDLRIPLKAVSRRHCQIIANNGVLQVRDLGSRNGTFLNNEKIDKTEASAGDYLRIGPLTFLLQVDGEPEEVVAPPKAPDKAKKAAPEDQLEEDFLDLDDIDNDDGPQLGEADLEDAIDDEFADLDDNDNADDSFLGELDKL